jgi:hypothetical protein
VVEGCGVPDSVGVGDGATGADAVGLGEGGAMGVVGVCDGTVGLAGGLVGAGLVGAGLVGAGLVGVGLVGAADGFAGDAFAVVLLGAGEVCPADGTDHGGVGESGVAVGCVDGNQVVRGVDRFRAGTPGRCPDRVTPDVRSTFGSRDVVLPNESVLCGACVVAES